MIATSIQNCESNNPANVIFNKSMSTACSFGDRQWIDHLSDGLSQLSSKVLDVGSTATYVYNKRKSP